MALPNCLCKLKHFTFYLRDLILERAEWNKEQDINWPVLHDLIAITTMSCLKNEGFKFLKKGVFGWAKHDKNVSLCKFRTTNGKILIISRLNGFIKFMVLFMITCFDGEVLIRAQIHFIDDDDLEFYEMKAEEKVAASIHFAPCGGFYLGLPVHLQYDVPKLLKSVYNVINPVREYITQNWQFNRFTEYIKYLPLILSETVFGKHDDQAVDDINEEGSYKISHTNTEKLFFLSPEMSDAQVKSKLIIYHYRDDESMNFLLKNCKSINRKDNQININHRNKIKRKSIENINEMEENKSIHATKTLPSVEDSEAMDEATIKNNSSIFSSFHLDESYDQIQTNQQTIKSYFKPQIIYLYDDSYQPTDQRL
uniref:Uncharacterized protein n=1 Tax=Rhodnius prolixus TaxID=13249 RepID=T1I193_RHOPR